MGSRGGLHAPCPAEGAQVCAETALPPWVSQRWFFLNYYLNALLLKVSPVSFPFLSPSPAIGCPPPCEVLQWLRAQEKTGLRAETNPRVGIHVPTVRLWVRDASETQSPRPFRAERPPHMARRADEAQGAEQTQVRATRPHLDGGPVVGGRGAGGCDLATCSASRPKACSRDQHHRWRIDEMKHRWLLCCCSLN